MQPDGHRMSTHNTSEQESNPFADFSDHEEKERSKNPFEEEEEEQIGDNPFSNYDAVGGNPFEAEEKEEQLETSENSSTTSSFQTAKPSPRVGHQRSRSNSVLGAQRGNQSPNKRQRRETVSDPSRAAQTRKNETSPPHATNRPRSSQSWSTRSPSLSQQKQTYKDRPVILLGSRSASNVREQEQQQRPETRFSNRFGSVGMNGLRRSPASRRLITNDDSSQHTTIRTKPTNTNTSFVPETANPVVNTTTDTNPNVVNEGLKAVRSDPDLYGGAERRMRNRASTISSMSEYAAANNAIKQEETNTKQEEEEEDKNQGARKRRGSLWSRLTSRKKKKEKEKNDTDEEKEIKNQEENVHHFDNHTKRNQKKGKGRKGKKKRTKRTVVRSAAEFKERHGSDEQSSGSLLSDSDSISENSSDSSSLQSSSNTSTGVSLDSEPTIATSIGVANETNYSSSSPTSPINNSTSESSSSTNHKINKNPVCSSSSSGSSSCSSPPPLQKPSNKNPTTLQASLIHTPESQHRFAIAKQSNPSLVLAASRQNASMLDQRKIETQDISSHPNRYVYGVNQVEKGAGAVKRLARHHDAINGQIKQAASHLDATARFLRESVSGEMDRSGKSRLPLPVPRRPLSPRAIANKKRKQAEEQEQEHAYWSNQNEKRHDDDHDDDQEKNVVRENVRRYMLHGDQSTPAAAHDCNGRHSRLTISPVQGQPLPRITLELGQQQQQQQQNTFSNHGIHTEQIQPPTEADLDEVLRKIHASQKTTTYQRHSTSNEIERLVNRARTQLEPVPEEQEQQQGGGEEEEEKEEDEPDDLEHDMPLFFDTGYGEEDVDLLNDHPSLLEELIGDPDDVSSPSFSKDKPEDIVSSTQDHENDDDEEEDDDDDFWLLSEPEDSNSKSHSSSTSEEDDLSQLLKREQLPSQTEAVRSLRLQQTTRRLSDRLRTLEEQLQSQYQKKKEEEEEEKHIVQPNDIDHSSSAPNKTSCDDILPQPSEKQSPPPPSSSSTQASVETLHQITHLYDLLQELVDAIDHDAIDHKQRAVHSERTLQRVLIRIGRAFKQERQRARQSQHRRDPAIHRLYEAVRLLDEKHRTLAERVAERLSAQNSHIYRYNKEQTVQLRRDLRDQGRQIKSLVNEMSRLTRRLNHQQQTFTGCLTTLFDVVQVLARSLDETRAEMGLFRDAYLQQQQFYRQQITFQKEAQQQLQAQHQEAMAAYRGVHTMIEGEVSELRQQNERERIKFDLLRKHVLEQQQQRQLRLQQRKRKQKRARSSRMTASSSPVISANLRDGTWFNPLEDMVLDNAGSEDEASDE